MPQCRTAADAERLSHVDHARRPEALRRRPQSFRAAGYRAGDLERRYPALGVEEDFFVDYGFVTRAVQP